MTQMSKHVIERRKFVHLWIKAYHDWAYVYDENEPNTPSQAGPLRHYREIFGVRGLNVFPMTNSRTHTHTVRGLWFKTALNNVQWTGESNNFTGTTGPKAISREIKFMPPKHTKYTHIRSISWDDGVHFGGNFMDIFADREQPRENRNV